MDIEGNGDIAIVLRPRPGGGGVTTGGVTMGGVTTTGGRLGVLVGQGTGDGGMPGAGMPGGITGGGVMTGGGGGGHGSRPYCAKASVHRLAAMAVATSESRSQVGAVIGSIEAMRSISTTRACARIPAPSDCIHDLSVRHPLTERNRRAVRL